MVKFLVRYEVTTVHEETITLDDETVEDYGGVDEIVNSNAYDFEMDLSPDEYNEVCWSGDLEILNIEVSGA